MKAIKISLTILFISLLPIAGFSQTIPDSSNVNIQIKVNRDTSGNFVRYDSTVVITWQGNNQAVLNSDSIFKQFFGDFKPFYETDSTFAKFFDITPEEHLFDIEKEFRRMDEMFIRQMQMMMNSDFFERMESKPSKPHNKKTSGSVKQKMNFNTIKI